MNVEMESRSGLTDMFAAMIRNGNRRIFRKSGQIVIGKDVQLLQRFDYRRWPCASIVAIIDLECQP
jgi:hypothetical protein